MLEKVNWPSLKAAVADASAREEMGLGAWYIVPVGKKWLVTDRMPLMGEWYSSDGVRHGK